MIELCKRFVYTKYRIKEKGVRTMLTTDRHALILHTLKNQGTITIHELVQLTNTSESTIRRDLSQLEKDMRLKRVHGGAAAIERKMMEPSMSEKAHRNTKQKQAIAKYAADLIEDGDCIYIDAGSTTIELYQYIKNKQIVVVTNGLLHIKYAVEAGMKAYMIGGQAKSVTGAMIGRGALISLEQYRFDKCFVGTNGIHFQSGFTTPDQEEAMVKEKALALSKESYVLADESKFSEVYFAKIATISRATIITNQLDEDMLKKYKQYKDIKVLEV